MTEPIDITKARAEARTLFTHGSARAVYNWALTHGTAMLDEADENDRIIQTLRRQRDEAEAALDRIRALSEEGKCWGGPNAIEEFVRRLDEILDGDQ